MKKFLTVLSLVAILGGSLPASARGHFDESNRMPQQQKHERVVVHKTQMPHEYNRPPVQEVHYVSHSNNGGAIIGGLFAGAIIGGLIGAIID